MHALAMSAKTPHTRRPPRPPAQRPMHAGPGADESGGDYRHEPVLLEAVLAFAPPEARLVVDCTLGGGGHALALLRHCPEAELFGSDRDPAAVEAARERLAAEAPRILLKHLAFSELAHHLVAGTVDFLLADLGVSSHQLDTGARGFSFSAAGPLDMRMDPTRGSPAAALVNQARPERLLEILHDYGEERFAPRIVHAIVAARAEAPIETTDALARIVAAAVPAKFHRRGFHPATRVFQALRIAVNDELGELERLLDSLPDLMAPGGRAALISFHSLEDRRVKERFRAWEQPCTCPPQMPKCVCGRTPLGRRLTRKPVTADADEAARNPRSRSAKLRVFAFDGAQAAGREAP